MKKTIFTLAALLIASATFIACSSSNDEIIEKQPVNPTGKYTMTIKASKGDDAATRALTLSGSTLKATWDADEAVLVYQGDTKLGTLHSEASDNESTTLTGELDYAPTTEGSVPLTFYFHTNATPSYGDQDGTLATIASSYDFCEPANVACNSFTVDNENNKVITSASINFGANQQAIAKFTLKKWVDSSILTPSALTVKVDVSDDFKSDNSAVYNQIKDKLPTYTLSLNDGTWDANGYGILYLAIPDITGKLATINQFLNGTGMTLTKNDFRFILSATVEDDTYILTKGGFPFEKGKYYEITAKLWKKVDVTGLTAVGTAHNGDALTGTTTYKVVVDPGATVTLSGVTIETSYDYCILSKEGTGTCTFILADGTTNTLTATSGNYVALGSYNENINITIKGSTGKLIASGGSGGNGSVGIGSSSSGCGNIVIEGGIIEAYGGGSAAGIGAGANFSCGNIEIKGGTIKATGANKGSGQSLFSGPGIGCAIAGTCGDIIISGGNITATGGERSAGIGSGNQGSGTNATSCGNIIISGGNITANGGQNGAGIGSGVGAACKNITITNGVESVTATKCGTYALDCIGRGYNGKCGTVTIDNVANPTPKTATAASGTLFPNLDSIVNGNTWTLTHPSE